MQAKNPGRANLLGRDFEEFERKIEGIKENVFCSLSVILVLFMSIFKDLSRGIHQAEQEHFIFCQRPDIRNRIGNHFQELAVCQADIICTTLEWSRNLYHKELNKIFIA